MIKAKNEKLKQLQGEREKIKKAEGAIPLLKNQIEATNFPQILLEMKIEEVYEDRFGATYIAGSIPYRRTDLVEGLSAQVGAVVLAEMRAFEENKDKEGETKDVKSQQGEVHGLNKLVDAIVPLAREYIDFKKEEFAAREKRIAAIGKHNRSLTYSLLAFLTGIITLMTILTLETKVSSDALLFLVGTLTGYMILWVQRLIFTPTEESAD
jgi:hypothetical protein